MLIKIGWGAVAILLGAAVVLLRNNAVKFGRDIELTDMPILWMVAIYSLLGLVVVIILPKLISATDKRFTTLTLGFVVIAGVAMRLSLFGSEPILEDDYNRYLWDGALTAAGQNPYDHSPEEIARGHGINTQLDRLRAHAGPVFDHINYPQYRTVYPPVAQAVFALSHWVAPYSLDGWRAVLLIFELACLGFILAILSHLGRSPLWVSLYWWHPVVIKEVANSAHLEPVLMLPVLAAIFTILRTRPVLSSSLLAIAAGVKIWPLLLAAPIGRQLLSKPSRLVLAVSVSAAVVALCLWPVLSAGLSETSGFVAYALKWRASSIVYIISEWFAVYLVMPVFGEFASSGVIARGLLAAILLLAIVSLCWRPAPNGNIVAWRFFCVAAAIYLLSPSQFPWYFVWIAPFLCFYPVRGLLLAGALVPGHYLYFHFAAHDAAWVYGLGIVWAMWLPVWALLAYDAVRAYRQSSGRGGELYAS